MVPMCENITLAEDELGKLAERHDGQSDGWGFVGGERPLSTPDGHLAAVRPPHIADIRPKG